jgi:hypothetical protein
MSDAAAFAIMYATTSTVLVAGGWLHSIIRSLSPV